MDDLVLPNGLILNLRNLKYYSYCEFTHTLVVISLSLLTGAFSTNHSIWFASNNSQFLLDDVNCLGNETSLDECSSSFDVDECIPGNYAIARCIGNGLEWLRIMPKA